MSTAEKEDAQGEVNYFTILYIGGDIKTLRNIERDADDKWRALLNQCNKTEEDASSIVKAAQDYAEAAHDCDMQRAYILRLVEIGRVNDECRRAVVEMVRGPHDGEKAKRMYLGLCQLEARTEKEDKESWENPFDGCIDWLEDGENGKSLVYRTEEEVQKAKAKARALVQEILLDSLM